MSSFNLYCNSLTQFSRYLTREVKVGDIGIGGNNPIRIQSMTTTDTMDTDATVAQSIRMIESGCELVRITAPSINEAQNLSEIKKQLRDRGYTTPLIADIHFTPNAAELAAKIIEKVRVNPGNYADKKKFEEIEYNDDSYNAELERIKNRFVPLVKICKQYGAAMRIGTNHGSLSDRIMSRYGDSPLGMVESALEFLRICEEQDYHDVVLSMKASNPKVMVQAYRLLISKMQQENMNYPLHLGVTEAGEGEDGRIKSAVGIGTLLEDGIGDTVRVSLTEDPEFEAPVAIALVDRYKNRKTNNSIPEIKGELPYSPFGYERRNTIEIKNIGGHQVPRIIADFSDTEINDAAQLKEIGYNYSGKLDKWGLNDRACDYIYSKNVIGFEIPGTLRMVYDAVTWSTLEQPHNSYPLFNSPEYLSAGKKSKDINFINVSLKNIDESFINTIKNDKTAVLIINTENEHGMAEQRRAFIELMNAKVENPVIIKREYSGLDDEHFQLHAATDVGALLLDGMGDGVWVKAAGIEKGIVNNTCFGILQATRTRISKTEYISCPSCGRTLFDLQETTAKIRKRTDHLKGLKIGIMGCIVNGPGEMADADYGYVGVGVDKITLYRGKEVVQRNIASVLAVDALINIIKEDGNWIEKEEA